MNCLLMVKEIEATGKTNAEKKLRWKPNYNFLLYNPYDVLLFQF